MVSIPVESYLVVTATPAYQRDALLAGNVFEYGDRLTFACVPSDPAASDPDQYTSMPVRMVKRYHSTMHNKTYNRTSTYNLSSNLIMMNTQRTVKCIANKWYYRRNENNVTVNGESSQYLGLFYLIQLLHVCSILNNNTFYIQTLLGFVLLGLEISINYVSISVILIL